MDITSTNQNVHSITLITVVRRRICYSYVKKCSAAGLSLMAPGRAACSEREHGAHGGGAARTGTGRRAHRRAHSSRRYPKRHSFMSSARARRTGTARRHPIHHLRPGDCSSSNRRGAIHTHQNFHYYICYARRARAFSPHKRGQVGQG